MSEWKDIESAPKDGTRILAVTQGNHPESGDPFAVAIAHWTGEKYGWQEDDFEKGSYVCPWELTHWMPLPPPPQERDK